MTIENGIETCSYVAAGAQSPADLQIVDPKYQPAVAMVGQQWMHIKALAELLDYWRALHCREALLFLRLIQGKISIEQSLGLLAQSLKNELEHLN
ncbi:MAG: hypothetical protein KF799_01170 [Bdellovibrionales bacterium]|nr:hypothetical protein [Bdellovibrionales bacterium]